MKAVKAILYKIGYPFALVWWWLRRPFTTGVRCVVVAEGQVLLVRHTYGYPFWTVPGGGIGHDEALESAVCREVWEETGVRVSEVQRVGDVYYEGEWRKDTINVFVCVLGKVPPVIRDEAEIAEARWFPLTALPSDTSSLCRQFLALAKKGG